MKDLVHIGIGQAGLQISEQLWQLYAEEHSINNQGKLKQTQQYLSQTVKKEILNERSMENLQTLFIQSEFKQSKYSAKSLLIDSEPSVADQLKKSKCKQFLNINNYVTWKEDSANNFSRGYNYIRPKISEQIQNRLRKIVEPCDNLQGFIFNNSLQGGTGSAISTFLLQNISTNYPKVPKINFVIYPSASFSSVIVGPYNAILSLRKNLQLSDLTLTIDNQSLYKIFKEGLDYDFPSYSNLNRLISQIQSSFLLSMRYKDCQLNSNIRDILTNLIPYPRIHFAYPTFAPTYLKRQIYQSYSEKSTQNIINNVFDRKMQMITNLKQVGCQQIISSILLLRGQIMQVDVYKKIQSKIKQLQVVQWSPTPFKIGIHHKKSTNFHQNSLSQRISMSACSFTCSHQYYDILGKLNHKFDIMYAKRAFAHWYVSDGMEQLDFGQARQDIAALQKDYQIWEGHCQYDEQEQFE